MEATAAAVGEEEKVFVALPAEFRSGKSTLAWALDNFCGSGATAVITHVHTPPQMIPVMGVKFHSSKLNPEQVNLFRRMERENVNKLLAGYVRQCSKMKVKYEKLVFENEDVVAGLVELIGLHRVTKLVISAAPDRQYSRKMDKPISWIATEIMQRADPSCKIWFVCKGQLICTRDNKAEIAATVAPPLPASDHLALQLSPPPKEDEAESESGFCDVLKEACVAGEELMKSALNESSRSPKADEEPPSALQKGKEYQELNLDVAKRHEELEEALAKANIIIAQLRLANHLPTNQQSTTMVELLQEETPEKLTLEQCTVDTKNTDMGAEGQLIEPHKEYARKRVDRGNVARELQALLDSKMTAISPLSGRGNVARELHALLDSRMTAFSPSLGRGNVARELHALLDSRMAVFTPSPDPSYPFTL